MQERKNPCMQVDLDSLIQSFMLYLGNAYQKFFFSHLDYSKTYTSTSLISCHPERIK